MEPIPPLLGMWSVYGAPLVALQSFPLLSHMHLDAQASRVGLEVQGGVGASNPVLQAQL